MEVIKIKLWNEVIGYLTWNEKNNFGSFQYEESFFKKGLDIAPLTMPISEALRSNRFSFPRLPKTYLGLPGLLSDSLPDAFGNEIIDNWLLLQGKSKSQITVPERLCYVGKRGMGALEFEPALHPELNKSTVIQIDNIIEVAKIMMEYRSNFKTNLKYDDSAILDIIKIATSIGGARAKAVIAINDNTNEIRSGQVDAPAGFNHWLIKLDSLNDKLGEPLNFGKVEYAYYLMAKDCGINMTECRLKEENGRHHFLTKRFDREGNNKLHMQSLCALAHYDWSMPGLHSYEKVFATIRKMQLPFNETKQQFRRMVFNVIARNQDDHTKNISFLMDKKGNWSLSPAYDLSYSYDPTGVYEKYQNLSINGKRDEFTKEDLTHLGNELMIKNNKEIIEQVIDSVGNWRSYANSCEIPINMITSIEKTHRLYLKLNNQSIKGIKLLNEKENLAFSYIKNNDMPSLVKLHQEGFKPSELFISDICQSSTFSDQTKITALTILGIDNPALRLTNELKELNSPAKVKVSSKNPERDIESEDNKLGRDSGLTR